MIGRLRGRVLERTGSGVVLDVAGVGYRIATTPQAAVALAKKRGEEAELFTHLAVKETALELYGFLAREELAFFELLITVSGIGPKTALGILSVAEPATIETAVAAGDASYLTKIAGIGKKSAERIVVELSGKIGEAGRAAGAPALREETDALEALRSLGYSASEAREALKRVPKETAGARERLREALKLLGAK